MKNLHLSSCNKISNQTYDSKWIEWNEQACYVWIVMHSKLKSYLFPFEH